MNSNPLGLSRNFWSLVKVWTPSVPPHDNASWSHAELERGWRTGHMKMDTYEVALVVHKIKGEVRMLKHLLLIGLIASVCLFAQPVGAIDAQTDHVPLEPQITEVFFELERTGPRVVLQGRNLLVSNRNIPPNGTPPKGNTGHLYGKALHFRNGDGNDRNTFSAGYYAPEDGRHDWIGLTQVSQSSDRIAFSLGSYFRRKPYAMNNGDRFLVSVNGATFQGTVTFRPLSQTGTSQVETRGTTNR
jgi:hypothetical protein